MKIPKDTATCINGILRLLVGGAFVAAGALKIADPAKFALDVSNYRLVPHELINLVAILLPWIELVAGSLVIAGIWLRAAALVIASLTVMFFAVIVSALARGLNIECGCFGTIGGKHIGLVNLAIDSTLLCLAALLARRSRHCPANEISREARTQNSALLFLAALLARRSMRCPANEIFREARAQNSAPPPERPVVGNRQRSLGAAGSLRSPQGGAFG